MTKTKAAKIVKILQAAISSAATELRYKSSFELLVAVILSAQATDKSVNKATEKLFAIANTPEQILALGEDNLKKYIKSIGLYNSKAKNIIKLSQILVAQYNSQIPDNRTDLENLPGVGRKTANVILNIIFKQPTIAVDTHVFRVANRTGIAKGKTPLEVEKKLLKVIPEIMLHDAHHLLVLHGRYTCLARKPLCYKCPIVDLCEFKNKNLPAE